MIKIKRPISPEERRLLRELHRFREIAVQLTKENAGYQKVIEQVVAGNVGMFQYGFMRLKHKFKIWREKRG